MLTPTLFGVRGVSRGFLWFGRIMAALGALGLAYGLWLLGDTGSFDDLPDNPASRCEVTETGVRIRDAVLDAELGIAYLAGVDPASGQGALYVLDLRAPRPLLIPIVPPSDLNPAGLGLYRAPDGKRSLFVIDRHPGAERVTIFDVEGARAAHRETISDPAFRSLNDIAPAGPRQFYVSNDRRQGFLGGLQTVLRLPDSDVLYFDGTLADPAGRALSMARGLVLSADGAHLYVAEGLAHRIRVYARNAASGALSEERRIPLAVMPDKLDRDAEGKLWLAGQTRLFRLFLHRLNARFTAPSQVLSLDPAHGAARLAYADGGAHLADARVALSSDGVLIAAARGPPALLICRMN
jgi:sugar lactone lactonase YvrE